VWRARDHSMEALEQRLGLGDRLPFDAVGHQRRRGLRDRAPRSLEADVLDAAVFDLEIDRQTVAAQRIVAFGFLSVLDLAEISRPFVVIEDDLLVQVVEIAVHANTSRTLPSARASASISSRVL